MGTDKLLYQVQNISFSFKNAESTEEVHGNATFALTFTSTINETYTTIPIKLYTLNPKMTCTQMESALLALPNYVIDGVSVNSTTVGFDVSFLVYFTGTSVSGPQNLLTVDTAECLDGCTPQLTGVDVASYGSQLSYVTEAVAADYNNYECGRRGKCDYDSGLCGCFEGYTGYKCQVQTALI